MIQKSSLLENLTFSKALTSNTAMTFLSILNPSLQDDTKAEMSEAPAYFADLNLDQIVASITAGKEEYNLAPFFHEALKSREAMEYRQEVMRDLENDARYDAVTRFANTMRSVREHLTQAGKLHYKYQKEAWLLDAVELYCQCVERLLSDLRAAPPSSPGLAGFFTFLDGYVGSPAFQQLLKEIATLIARLAPFATGCSSATASSPSRTIMTSPITGPKFGRISKSSNKARPPITFSSS